MKDLNLIEIKRKLKGYVFTRNFGKIFLPVFLQNKLLKDYCNLNNYEYLLPVVESHWDNCFHQLFSLSLNIRNGDEIVLYSVAMLPTDGKFQKIENILKKKNVLLHFVMEGFTSFIDGDCLRNEIMNYSIKKYISNDSYKVYFTH